MVYECEKCGAALPAGVQACPNCGENFSRVVPQDAGEPKHGWQAKSEEPAGPQPSFTSAFPGTRLEADTGIPEEPHPSRNGQNNADRDYWQNKFRQAGDAAARILEHPAGQRLKRNPVLGLVVLILIIFVFAALIRPHTNSYIFDQHPMYQANMASFTNVARSRTIDYIWPFEGHEDRLQAVYHPNSFGGNSSQIPSELDLDNAAVADRLGFCAIRYRSGFTPDDAMKCQVYVAFDGSSASGYNGPETNQNRDIAIKGQLGEVR